jgi:hypothetical protein
MIPFAFLEGIFYDDYGGRTLIRAMPLMILVLAILAIAYRYYSAFLAAHVATLDDSRETPAHTLYDGQNYHPTNRWVLFGHHFAAISGAGPLIGPVLAIQFGYFPGLIWLVVGVCLAGAVQACRTCWCWPRRCATVEGRSPRSPAPSSARGPRPWCRPPSCSSSSSRWRGWASSSSRRSAARK